MVKGSLLDVADHGGNTMGCSMVAELETLHASRRTGHRHHVFPFVSILLLRSRQAFALDWQEGVELGVPAAFDSQDRSAGLGSEVDGPSATDFVPNFGAELNPAPPG